MVCHGVKDPSILVSYAMKSQTIKIIYLVSMVAFSSLILASCAVVEKIDSLNGILEEPTADYEVRELKKGEEAFFNEKYKEAERLFSAVSINSGNDVYQNYALYGIACIKMITAENAEEFKNAIELLESWKYVRQEIAGYYESPRMIITAFNQQSHLLDREPEIKEVVSKESEVIIKKQQREIQELNNTIKKLQHQISVLETIDQDIQEKRQPI
jgi:hypothetical protein